jgi:phage terminase large subunit-like protein
VTKNSEPSPITYDPALVLQAFELEISIRKSERRLSTYNPYPKQAEFHEQGAVFRERLLLGGNRIGKTECGAAELAMHLTGYYPEWWVGKRFDKPVRAWAAGVTGESTRDVVQAKLFGPPERPEAWGTGLLPKAAIARTSTGRGIAGAIDTAAIHHKSGGYSSLAFKSYERGREKWQGAGLEVVWFDEEPEEDIYLEGLTRTNETGGCVYLTCTPLLGMSSVMKRFLMGRTTEQTVIQAGLEDAGHFTDEQRRQIIASYPEFERDARTKGIPQLGSGRVFPISEGAIACESFPIPQHWPRICGIDFGWDHPSAGVECVWNRDSDTFYVIAAHRARAQTPIMFAAAVRPWGEWPWAWPHDGLQHDKGSGEQLMAQYKAQGLKMLGVHATFEDGTNGVEAGIMDMLDRMETGRFKVFRHLQGWFEEFNLYHRKDGKIVKEGDDLMSATRYALMCKRLAIVQKPKHRTFTSMNAPSPQGWMG